MGYSSTANTLTITARLTPTGRQKLVTNKASSITKFSLGDSDANYYASLPLETGDVPSIGGSLGAGSSSTNSSGPNLTIDSRLILDKTGALTKAVETQSSGVTIEYVANGSVALTGSSINSRVVDRNNNTTDKYVNLFYSFGLPLNTADDTTFTGTSTTYGGFSNTAMSGFAQSKVIVLGLNSSLYGELIDGKQVKVELSGTTTGFTLYSTFQKTNVSSTIQDAKYRDESPSLVRFGDNVALLFSDSIKKPNGSSTLSWATGFGTNKPFSVNKKQLFNLTTTEALGYSADTAVGIAYLDKGFVVITDPTIVNTLSSGGTLTATTTVTLNSISSKVLQNIVCIANGGEFATSNNTTFTIGDTPRISEIGLYDNENTLIAVAKTDRHLVRNINQLLALGIKISF